MFTKGTSLLRPKRRWPFRISCAASSQEPLLGTVKPWNAHVVISTAVPAVEWPKDISHNSIARELLQIIESKKATWKLFGSTKVSLCNLHPDTGESVYLFSNVLKYPLQFRNYDSKITTHIVSIMDHLDSANGVVNPSTMVSGLFSMASALVNKNIFAFVCAHKSMDERCGACGPQIFEELKKLIDLLKFESEFVPLNVGQISHVGGHKYAGNLLIYPPGDLYGRVTEANVIDIVKTHILSRRVVEDNWRGRMGVPVENLRQLLSSESTSVK